MTKTTLYITAAVAAALSLAACSKPAQTAAESPKPDPVSATQDAAGAAVGQVAASTTALRPGGWSKSSFRSRAKIWNA